VSTKGWSFTDTSIHSNKTFIRRSYVIFYTGSTHSIPTLQSLCLAEVELTGIVRKHCHPVDQYCTSSYTREPIMAPLLGMTGGYGFPTIMRKH